MEGQFAYRPFSTEEIENLNRELEKIRLNLEDSPNNWDNFINSPISYLAKFNITLLNRFQNNSKLAEQFNDELSKILRKIRRIFNKCLACKIGVMIFVYALIGDVGYMINFTLDLLNAALSVAEKYLKGTSRDSNSLLNRLSSTLDQLSIPELALTICRHYKQCSEPAD